MAVTPCPCSLRQEDWTLDCDIADHNGIRCGSDPDGQQVIWAPPDDGIIHFDETPVVKAAYVTALGATYDPTETGVSTFGITDKVTIEWENTTCHVYRVLTEYIMGSVSPVLGKGTAAYAGTENYLVRTETDGSDSVLEDSIPYIGAAYNDYSTSAFGLMGQVFPPTLWPVWARVEPGESLLAQLKGWGDVNAAGGGGAESVSVLYGWRLVMTGWPVGIG